MKSSKVLFILLTLLLLSSTVVSGFAVGITEVEGKLELNPRIELINIEDIDKHLDVKGYIKEKGYEKELKSEKHTDKYILEKYGLENQYEKKTFIHPEIQKPIKKEKLDKIITKYNLDKPTQKVVSHEQYILVEKETTMASAYISNLWIINYITTDTSFSVVVTNLGLDSIDRIYGTLKKINLNSSTWSQNDSKYFSKYSVSSGNVYTWYEGRNAVSDYFTYDISVSEDGYTYHYDNAGEKTYQRYYFDADAYNSLTSLGGERHHLVSAKALTDAGFNSNYAADSEGKYPNLQQKYYDELIYTFYLLEEYFGISNY